MAEQYPHVRTLTWCCACGHDKPVGNLLCWECHHGFKALYDGGYGPFVEAQLAKIERREYTPRLGAQRGEGVTAR